MQILRCKKVYQTFSSYEQFTISMFQVLSEGLSIPTFPFISTPKHHISCVSASGLAQTLAKECLTIAGSSAALLSHHLTSYG